MKQYFILPKRIYAYVLAMSMFSVGGSVISFLVLILSRDFGLEGDKLGMVYNLVFLSMIPTSLLGARVGRRHKAGVIMLSRIIYGLSFLAYGIFSSSVPGLVLLLLAFLMMGISRPSMNSFVVDIAPANGKRQAYSAIFVGTSIGGIISPVLMARFFGDTAVAFRIYALFTFLGVALVYAIYRSLPKEEEQEEGSGQAEVKKRENFSPGSFFRKDLLLFLSAFTLLELCLSQQIFSLPLALQKSLPQQQALWLYSALVSVNAFAFVLLNPLLISLTAKTKVKHCLLYAGLAAASGYGGLLFAFSYIREPLWQSSLFVWLIIWTAGEVLYNIYAFVALTENFPQMGTGLANALVLCVRSVGIILGTEAAQRFGIEDGGIWKGIASLALLSCLLLSRISFKKEKMT